ncbi:hypothetical protein D3C86_2205600 [compost metagenome]
MAPKALAKRSRLVPSRLGQRIGKATIRQYCQVEAPRISEASRHSFFRPSRAGVRIRTISGIWKNM